MINQEPIFSREMAMEKQVYDLLITQGHVIDPANNIDEPMDVAVTGGKISLVQKNIPCQQAKQCVNVKGSYVIPGIIDIHAHVYPMLPRDGHCLEAVDADAHLLKAGVTTVVDAGTTGWRDFLFFKKNVIDQAKVRVLAMLNIAACGMVDMRSEQTFKDMQPKVAAAVAETYPETIVGIKAAHYWGGPKPFDDEHPPWASVDKTLEAAELSGLPAMIDFQPNLPQSPYADLVTKKLRPGDIHTHVFAQQFPIVDDDGKVLEHMHIGRQRGVYFDLGHGAGSFWFRNGLRALRDGFPPDTLSTDLHMGNIYGAVLSMLQVMAKYHNMGMPLQEVVMRSTSMPAKLIRRPDLGTLTPGSCADIAVFRKLEGDFGYVDNGKARIDGTSMFDCQMTIRQGNILFDAYGLSMPLWEDAPHAYWNPPYKG